MAVGHSVSLQDWLSRQNTSKLDEYYGSVDPYGQDKYYAAGNTDPNGWYNWRYQQQYGGMSNQDAFNKWLSTVGGATNTSAKLNPDGTVSYNSYDDEFDPGLAIMGGLAAGVGGLSGGFGLGELTGGLGGGSGGTGAFDMGGVGTGVDGVGGGALGGDASWGVNPQGNPGVGDAGAFDQGGFDPSAGTPGGGAGGLYDGPTGLPSGYGSDANSVTYGNAGGGAGGGLSGLLNGLGLSGGALGGILGGLGGLLGGGSRPAGNVTTTNDLPDWLKPYVTNNLNAAANSGIGTSTPLLDPATQEMLKTINGDYLDPAKNPYLQSTYDQAAKAVTDNYLSTTQPRNDALFNSAGAFGPTNSAWTETNARNQFGLGQNLQNLATNIFGGNYNVERGRQVGATVGAPGFTQGYFQGAYSPYTSFADLYKGLGVGTQTSPYFTNPFGSAASGALAGYQIGKAFG